MSNTNRNSLGELIKKALKEKGLNQSAVAKKMNVSKQVINQIDRRKHFDLDFLQKLKDVTDIDFTNYSFGHTPKSFKRRDDEVEEEEELETGTQQIEMALAIKLKADPYHINKMGELLLSIKKEATRLGFTIL